MRRALPAFLFALACLIVAAAAHAQPYPGVGLRWDHCFGEGTGLANRMFACDRNTGFEQLIGSFAIPQDMVNVSGNEIVVDVTTGYPTGTPLLPPSNPPLPEWWKYKSTGTCRQTSLNASFAVDPTNAVCQDWAQGLQAGGIAAYAIDYYGQGTARLVMAVAVPPDAMQPLYAGIEYYSFTLLINHSKTVGTGACGGCSTPLYVRLRQVDVVTNTPANDRLLSGPLNGADSDFVSWNVAPVPTRTTSWAEVKSLYR